LRKGTNSYERRRCSPPPRRQWAWEHQKKRALSPSRQRIKEGRKGHVSSCRRIRNDHWSVLRKGVLKRVWKLNKIGDARRPIIGKVVKRGALFFSEMSRLLLREGMVLSEPPRWVPGSTYKKALREKDRYLRVVFKRRERSSSIKEKLY